MAGTWIDQNKVLPGAYINIKTNVPLSIAIGDRGTVVLLERLTVEGAEAGKLYRATALENDLPEGYDRKLLNEALKGAVEVLIYNLGTEGTLESALDYLKTVTFNVIAFPNATEGEKTELIAWIDAMREQEGVKVTGVLANTAADKEFVINVVQGIKLADNTELTTEEVTAYVAGITAGANINKSNTGLKYQGAIDVVPRMTKTEMETAIKAGKYIFKVDNAQNVTSVYDINSLTTFTVEKDKTFTKNRVLRTLDGINNDIVNIFESNFIGKINNNVDGRSILRATLIEYFNELQRLNAIQNFSAEDVEVLEGKDKDSVVINCNIQTVDSVEKMYITVNLS